MIRGKHRNVKIEQVYDMQNLKLAEKEARRGKGNKYGVRKFDKDKEGNLLKIQEMLINRTYHTSTPRTDEQYCPCGKVRMITKLPYYPDHIIHHALMRVIMPSMTKSYYADSFASIKGRGIELARRRVRRFIDLHKGEDIVFAKLDFTKFYQNIRQDKVYGKLCEMYHDDGIRWLLKEVVTTLDDGLGIGLYPIQPIANFYLNELDRKVGLMFGKEVHLFRYCDDIVLMGFNTKTVWKAVDMIRTYASDVLEQPFHTNINVEHLTDSVGLSFVGYKFYKNYTLIRKRIKIRFKKKVAKIDDDTMKRATLASYKGWLMHSDGRNLWKKVTGMKSFSELNIRRATKGKNGQVFFDVPTVSCGFIVGRTIFVKDFQTNVTTKNGGGRYVVLIEEGGRDCKFLTNNPRLKDVLDQCREQNAFPFEATLKSRSLGGNKIDYYFE
jgi:hypothetical protein